MKYTIHGGHGYPGKGAIGVVGYINESIQNRVVAEKVASLLSLDGHEVHNITVDEGTQNKLLSKLVQKANPIKADLNLSIHFNAANGKASGTEVWIKEGDDRAKDVADRIVNSIATMGFLNRGVKHTNDLYILNQMTAPTILIECCFADNKGDFVRYDADKMAMAIAESVVGHRITKAHIAHTAELCDIRNHGSAEPVFRLHNPNTGDHFYTNVLTESDILIDAGWTFERIAWYAPIEGAFPVFRTYNPNNGKHFYSLDKNEVAAIVNAGWVFEGIAWRSDFYEKIPVYRLYNEKSGQHIFTANQGEVIPLLASGNWFQEGIGWYAAEV